MLNLIMIFLLGLCVGTLLGMWLIREIDKLPPEERQASREAKPLGGC